MKQIQTELIDGYTSDIKPMELTPNQELALGRMSRLVIGAIYLFPAQVFHSKKTEYSPTGYSNRAACYEIAADGSIIAIRTLSYSALRAIYLGRITETSKIPIVRAENRDGLYRPVRGTEFISNKKGGEPPIDTIEKDGVKVRIIKYPFALKVTGRSDFYTTVLERRDDGRYDMQVDSNGNLAIATRNDYEFEYVVPTKEMLESMNPEKDMAKLKDYLL